MKAYSSKAIANEFIRLAQKDGGLTHMQIQKLIYFAHALSLVAYDRPLVKKKFQAWPYGPVDLDVFLVFRGSGKQKIKNLIQNIDQPIDSETHELIALVYQKFGKKTGWKLSELTHEGAPWKEAYKPGESNIISNEDIKKYYKAYWEA